MEYLRSTTGTLASTVGVKNPIRYRGYYYDVETGLYDLQSRYYDPQTGRFINADDTDYLGADGSFESYNLFAYCNNNSVNNSDSSGNLAVPWQIKVGLASGVASAIWQIGKYIAKNWKSSKSAWNYMKGLGKAAATGFIRGFVVGLMSTIPRAWFYGLIGGTFELIFKIMDGKVKSVSSGISAFFNGWTKGVMTKTLNRLFTRIFKGVKWKKSTKEYVKYASSLLATYNLTKYFTW